MKRIPLAQVIGILIGSSVVLALFVARGFSIGEHARIVLGALTLVWLVGCAWTLATAAEQLGGWKRLGGANAVLVLVATIAAAFAPVLVLVLWGLAHAR
jgi:hypothetical protein